MARVFGKSVATMVALASAIGWQPAGRAGSPFAVTVGNGSLMSEPTEPVRNFVRCGISASWASAAANSPPLAVVTVRNGWSLSWTRV